MTVVIEPPDIAPISLVEAKAHLRVDYSTDDTLITSLIAAATQNLDGPSGRLGRSLITQTLELRDSYFPDYRGLVLPYPPVQSIVSVKYIDSAGTLQTISSASYTLIGTGSTSRLVAGYNVTWPTPRGQDEAIMVQYVAGYGDVGTDIPAPIKQAMLLMIGDWYATRETVVVGQSFATLPAAEALLAPYRIW